MSFTDTPRICFTDGCENLLPDDAPANRKYCDAHATPPKTSDAPKRPRGRPRKEVPPKVVFELGTPKATKETKAKKINKAAMIPRLGGNVLAMRGDQVCAQALTEYAVPWAAAVVELSEYEPWLAKFLEGSESSGKASAWISVALITGGMLMPVLAHHDLLPPWVGAMIGGVFVASTTGQPDPQTASAAV